MSVKISYKTINMGQKITKSWWRISVLPLRKFTHLNSSNQHKSLFFKKWFDLLDFTKEWWCTSFCFSVPRPSECALKQLLARIFRSNLGLFSLKNSTSERFKAKTLNSLCDGTLSLEQDYQKTWCYNLPACKLWDIHYNKKSLRCKPQTELLKTLLCIKGNYLTFCN